MSGRQCKSECSYEYVCHVRQTTNVKQTDQKHEHFIFKNRVTIMIRASLIISSKVTVFPVSSPPNSSVTHGYKNIFSPHDFPVTTTSHNIFDQHQLR
ncbi:hypothetical protein F2P81_009305 [Scophthalmus maximus]|uniref:Uncharacterized protein n=1 Tax=Scophthalmus maximus TaxID=52904 RepID=A0A6A4T6S5_SCOMX|nr:hypothetical protein F2P81_009305 [Scophthalmus maximus]